MLSSLLLNDTTISKRVRMVGQILNLIGLISFVAVAVSLFIFLAGEDTGVIAALIFLCSGIVSIVQGYLLYGFGQIIENTKREQ